MNITIHPFNPERSMPVEWQALNSLENQRDAEVYPDDPPRPVEQTMRFWHALPPVLRVAVWIACTGDGEPAGWATCEMMDMPENHHMVQSQLYVCPAWRRKGIGSRLLAEVVRTGLADGRRVLILEAIDRVPAGLAFARRMGGEVGLAMHINQLDLSQVSRELLQNWRAQAAERGGDFELVFWDGPYPEHELEQLAPMMQAMNEAPSGDLDVGDIQWTPDLLRQVDVFNQGRGYGR